MKFSVKAVKETCLYVQDLDKTQAFYHHKLNMPVISKVDNRHIFFRAGNSVLLCFIAKVTEQENHLPPHGASGIQHIAFEVPAEDYQKQKAAVKLAGIPILHEEAWPGNYHSFYFHDPDGHLLEVVPEGMWE